MPIDFGKLVAKEAVPKAKSVIQANVDPKMKPSELIKIIMSETGMTNKSLTELYERKREELKGLISEAGALYIIAREHGISDKDDKPIQKPVVIIPKTTETTPKVMRFGATKQPDTITKAKTVDFTIEEPKPVVATPETALALTTTTPDFTAIQNTRPLTFEEKKVKILQTMALIEYTANNALNKDDFWTPKGTRKKALTRSGCNKLATIFNITTETLKIWVVKEPNIKGEDDIVAYATVKATRPGGSSVTITANKALSSYESDRPGAKPPREWVDMQALKGTAETRASNRAIQNAIGVVPKGYMVATAEEFNRKG